MRKVIMKILNKNGTVRGYYLDGISEMISEDRLFGLISKGEAACDVLDDGTIDTRNMIVYESDDEDIIEEYDDEFNIVDMELVNVCAKIRKLAKLERLEVQEEEHTSNNALNTHLFNYLRYCGKDIKTYIKEYLSNLQPYMLQRRKDQEPDKQFLCVLDTIYRVSIYIKIYQKQFEELVVSFHEDNRRGIAKTNDLITKERITEKVFVFADSEQSRSGNKYGITIFSQRGVLILPIELVGYKYRNGYIVNRRDIDNQFLSYCNDYIKDLYCSDLNLDFDSVSVFSMLQQISFTSYGRDTFSGISLLIDSVSVQKDALSRGVAISMLEIFVTNLKLSDSQKEELFMLLNEKYSVTSIKNIGTILDRVRLGLFCDTLQ